MLYSPPLSLAPDPARPPPTCDRQQARRNERPVPTSPNPASTPVPTADRVARIRAAAGEHLDHAIALTAKIAAIPAPTGDEAARARVVASVFAESGLDPLVDRLDNVVALIPGRERDGPALLLAAHIDTVFARSTPLSINRRGERLHGPGIGDNSLGVGALLTVAHILRAARVVPAVDLLLTGNVGEEGLGNLVGMRAVMDAHPRIGAAVAIEGHNLGRVTHIAVGSRRLRVSATGPGGHSWGDFGRPSAVHALARIVADLAALSLPRSPKTTLNVGMIDGGVSVNTIAPTASCLIDLRSVDAEALDRLADRAARIIGKNAAGVRVTCDVLGERPAGMLPLESPIVRLASATLDALGLRATFDASSTDANVPIARGIPAVCIGLTTGGNVHRDDEYIDLPPFADGLAQVAMLALELADALAEGRLPRLDARS